MADWYTKAVLTVIAACLLVIALRGVGPSPAQAQMGQTHVVIDSVSSYAFQYAGPLEVHSR